MLLFIRHNKKGRAKMARFLYSAFSDEAADSIDGQIAACKANGVTHMELRGVDGKNISESVSYTHLTLPTTPYV